MEKKDNKMSTIHSTWTGTTCKEAGVISVELKHYDEKPMRHTAYTIAPGIKLLLR